MKPLIAALVVGATFYDTPSRAATKGEMMGVFTDLRDEKTAPAIKALGLGRVRIMYHWTWLEQSKGKMTWSEFDQWVARAKAQHLKVLILQTPTLRSVLANHGVEDKPVWFTEYGVPTGGPFGAVTPEESGLIYQHYYDAFDRLTAQGIKLGPMFFWTLNDSIAYQKANAIEGWEGIFDLNGAPKASVNVIRARAAKPD